MALNVTTFFFLFSCHEMKFETLKNETQNILLENNEKKDKILN